MTNLEKAVVELVRFGLTADPSSVRQYSRRLIKRGDEDGFTAELRAALVTVLAAGQDASRVLRAPGGTLGGTLPAGAELSLVDVGRLSKPALDPHADAVVQQIIAERRSADRLLEHGLEPTKSLLLTGPPGVGKTMTARHVAAILGLPLIVVDLAQVVSSYLGKTGQNLREVLDFGRTNACVLLLDEFDALAKRRDDPADVGELKRIVNVLLLEMESWPAESILIAATNHPELLDRAVWRRFDRWIELALPDEARRAAIIEAGLATVSMSVDRDAVRLLSVLTDGFSGSDLARMVREAARSALLGDGHNVFPAMLHAVGIATFEGTVARAKLFRAAHEIGMSNRALGRLLGTSHVTVAGWAKLSDARPMEDDG